MRNQWKAIVERRKEKQCNNKCCVIKSKIVSTYKNLVKTTSKFFK